MCLHIGQDRTVFRSEYSKSYRFQIPAYKTENLASLETQKVIMGRIDYKRVYRILQQIDAM